MTIDSIISTLPPIPYTCLRQGHEHKASYDEVGGLAVDPVQHGHEVIPEGQRELDLHLLSGEGKDLGFRV